MGVIVVVLAIIGFLVLFAYLKFPPDYAKPQLVGTYNMMVLGVCAFLCLVWVLYTRTSFMNTPSAKWWVPIAIAGALGIEIVFLGLCFLLRNFWIFKPPRHPGSGGFF